MSSLGTCLGCVQEFISDHAMEWTRWYSSVPVTEHPSHSPHEWVPCWSWNHSWETQKEAPVWLHSAAGTGYDFLFSINGRAWNRYMHFSWGRTAGPLSTRSASLNSPLELDVLRTHLILFFSREGSTRKRNVTEPTAQIFCILHPTKSPLRD